VNNSQAHSERKDSRRLLRPHREIAYLLPLTFIALFFALSINITLAQATVPVTFNLISIDYGTCTDGPGDPPELIYTGMIDGQLFATWIGPSSPPPEESPNPWNVNAAITRQVDPANNPIEITLNLTDYPVTLSSACDISPSADDTLTLFLDLNNCSISGDVAGVCNGIYDVAGNDASRSSTVRFSIYAPTAPPATATYIRCMHSPVWPKHGEDVTITAEALDGSLNPVSAQSLGAYFEGQIGIPTNNVSTVTRTIPYYELTSANTLMYQCEMTNNGATIGTGWREVQIGGLDPVLHLSSLFQPPTNLNRAVPILNTGPKGASIDVVFIADSSTYAQGANDPTFQSDVYEAIRTGYYSEAIFLEWQQYLNFWIALDTGTFNGPGQCDYTIPIGDNFLQPVWYTLYAWADTGAMLHHQTGGCAYRSSRILASIVAPNYRTLLHESGHSPFGLSDEYANGDTSYFVPNPYPNIYRTEEACIEDAPNLLPWDPTRVGTDCRSFIGRPGQTWWKSEPEIDLMNHNQTINGADLRRMDYIFDRCTRGQC